MAITELPTLRVLTCVCAAESIAKVRMINTSTTPEVSRGPARPHLLLAAIAQLALRQSSLLFPEFYINGITLSALFFFWFLSLSIIISRFACDSRPFPRVSDEGPFLPAGFLSEGPL